MRLRLIAELPYRSQEMEHGPRFAKDGAAGVLSMDYEDPAGGRYLWDAISFLDVAGHRYTAPDRCTVEQVEAYDRLMVVEDSQWLASQDLDGTALSHFIVYFDERGCHEVIAREVVLSDLWSRLSWR